MANREGKKVNKQLNQQLDTTNRDYGRVAGGWESRAKGLEDRSDSNYNAIFGGYQNLLNRGGNLDEGIPSLGGRGGGGGDFGRSEFEGMRPFIQSLGADLSDEEKDRMRGLGVYDEFARTGGLSDADVSNLRLRASRTGAATYDSLKDDLDRINTVQGGNFNPGYGAQQAKLARDRARGVADAALDAETGIIDTRNQGRLAGAAGAASSEGNLQSLLMQRILGAGGLQQAMASGLLNSDVASSDADYRLAGLDLQRELGALGGMRDLYATAPGELGMTDQNILGAYGARGGEAGNLLNLRAQYNPNTSFMDRLTQLGGMALPIATAFMGGGGASTPSSPFQAGGGAKKGGYFARSGKV